MHISYTYLHILTIINIFLHSNTYAYTYTYTARNHASMFLTHIGMHIYILTIELVCTYTHTHTHTQILIDTRIYIAKFIHTQMCVCTKAYTFIRIPRKHWHPRTLYPRTTRHPSSLVQVPGGPVDISHAHNNNVTSQLFSQWLESRSGNSITILLVILLRWCSEGFCCNSLKICLFADFSPAQISKLKLPSWSLFNYESY